MIQGYVTPSSVSVGNKITIHTGAVKGEHRNEKGDISKFRTYFFRRGANWELKGKSDVWTADAATPPKTPAQDYAPDDAASDWKWPGVDFTIPRDWRSGAYVAVFVPEDGRSAPPANPDDKKYYFSRALFVINVADEDPGTNATILYKIPLFTYCAYNHEGNTSLYEVADVDDPPRNFKVTLNRPGCGVGGDPWDGGGDAYDSTSVRNSFLHWDAPFISWLESNGYNVDYCTDLDIHENKDDFLKNYNLLLSVGHDEYWSAEKRSNLEAFVARGKNLAFFSGNTCWWKVSLCDGNTGFTCNKVGDADQWRNSPNPEAKLLGVTYANAGGWWDGERTKVGFTVQNSDHWVYSGTGLAEGATFGQEEAIVGFECDGAKLAKDRSGKFVPSHEDGCPSTFVILGVGQLDGSWQGKGRERRGEAATMGVWADAGKGTIFAAPTTDWARVLNVGGPTPARKVVDRITRNVLDRLNKA
jgi:hypothetical protein